MPWPVSGHVHRGHPPIVLRERRALPTLRAQAKLLHSQRQLSTILPSNQHRSTLPITALIQLQQQQQHRLTLPRPFFPLHHHPYHRPSDRRLLLLLLLEEMAVVEEPVAMATVAMGYVW